MSKTLTSKFRLTAVAILCMAGAAVMMAQVTTTTSEKKGAPRAHPPSRRAKSPTSPGTTGRQDGEGEVRHFAVPAGATATVDGKR